MANLNLYEIHGLDEIDTIQFDTVAHQKSFFEDHIVSTPTQGFYVPHFKDKIILPTDDITFDTLINYASIEYGNRIYYYFITEIRYIDETAIEISLALDTIQTYLFSIHVNSATVVRESIKRWVKENNVWKINRGYLRENISTGIMKLKYYKNYGRRYSFSSENTARDYGLLVIRCGKELSKIPFTGDYGVSTPIWSDDPDNPTSDKEVQCNSPYYTYILPMSRYGNVGNVTIKKRTGQSTYVDDGVVSYNKVFELIAREPNVIDMKWLPYGTVANLYMSNGNIVYDPDYWDNLIYNNDPTIPLRLFGCNRSSGIHIMNVYDDVTLDITRENFIYAYFSARYVPCMIDNNYMRVSFGEGGVQTTLPLEHTKTTALRMWLLSDVSDGSRYYQITFEGEVQQDSTKPYEKLIPDVYATRITANKPFMPDVIYDASNEWEARNRYTALTTLAQVGIRAFALTQPETALIAAGEAMLKWSATDLDIARGTGDINEWLPALRDYRERLLHQNHLEARRNAGIAQSAGTALSFINEALNIRYAPDSAKVSGNIATDFFSKAMYPRLEIYEVQDFDKCARYFESEGYLVNTITFSSDILTTKHNRYYFDVLKLTDINLDIMTAIDSERVKNDIISRLEKGLRLWHTEVRNNKVHLFIEDTNSTLGQACKYNNAEVYP